MAFTVEDFQDLLRLLGEHPEWQAELRRHVLTGEILSMPAAVGRAEERLTRIEAALERLAEAQVRSEQRLEQLAEAQVRTEQRLEQLAEAQARTEQRLYQLAEAQARTEERVQQLAEAQARTEERLLRLEVAVAELVQALGKMEVRLGHVEGEVLELRYARRAPAYFSRLARRLRVLDTAAVADLLDEAIDQGRLAESDREPVLDADLVLTGRRRSDGADVYFVAEISVGIGPGDVERAAQRARILATLGRPAVPIVAGRQVTAEAVARAKETGVWQVLDGAVISPESL